MHNVYCVSYVVTEHISGDARYGEMCYCFASALLVMVRLLGIARISLGLRCKKSEEREGKKKDWEGKLTERTQIWTPGMAEGSERQSQALELKEKSLSLEGNTNIVLLPQNHWREN